jgi:HlyD family secretion protein
MLERIQHLWRRRRGWFIAGIALIVGAGLTAGSRVFGARSASVAASGIRGIPVAEVTQGDLVDTVELRGDVKALHSVPIFCPSNAGDIQIVKLAANGSTVHKGDVVATLDPSTLQIPLNQRRSDLKQAQAQVADAQAQAKLTEEQDQTDVLTAKYDAEKARLDASQAEILSAIDGEEKKLTLADAEQKYKQTQQKLEADQASAKANIVSLREKQAKAERDVQQYEDALSRLTLRAPSDGMVSLQANWRNYNGGDSAPPFKEGDRAWAGAVIAELPDMSSLYLDARSDEADRGRVQAGQVVTARVDALPDRDFPGKIHEISPLAKPDFSNWPLTMYFDVMVALDHPDDRLRPGMSVSERIAVDKFPNVIMVPKEAVFAKNGHSVAYVLVRGDDFEERAVNVGHRGGGQVEVVSGLRKGEHVALKDPTLAANR